MGYHERHLPHWQPESASVFVTWRLFGSLPRHLLLKQDEVSSAHAFREFDRVLDKAEYGPVWLKDPRIAECMLSALQFGKTDMHLYELVAFCIMANHVHLLIEPSTRLSQITRALKGFTAREANRILERTGRRFWQDESYDRWIRDKDALNRVIRYIEHNPVSAGLVTAIEDYPWSSAFQRT
jgi:REP element-mobilizing transposase RayT